MPIEENKLLVITPQPFNYESLRGFLLRVSEENGYTSPSSIAKLMGIKESVLRSRKLPTDHLAKLLGEFSNKLDRYSYITKDQKSTSSLKILEHVLESNYAHLQLRSGAQFCPICAKEDGHIDAFWDLGIALACPTHNVKPLSRCAKCCRTINWFRPGLNSCDCGADYLKAPLEKSEPMHTELLKIIHTKLHNKSILDLPNKYQFPLVHFEKLSLGQLLSILYKFGGMSKFYDFGADFESYDEDTSPYAAKALKVGAIIFSAWPNGYVEFLHRYFNNVDTLGRKYLQSTQYKRLVDELAGNNLANRSGDFLIDELLLFGSTELKFPKPSYTPKTRKIRALMNTFSYYKGFDDAPLEEQLLYSGKTILKPEEAAKCIGLPINVMELFWSSGVMKNYLHSEISKSMKFPWFKEVVNEILETIKKRNIPGFRRSSVRNERYIILEQFMIKENIRDEIKVALLEDIFYEKIPVHGRIGRKLSGLLLRKSEIKEYISNKNKVLKDEHLSIHDAAMFLETDEYGVEFLIRLGYLHYIVVGIERRIPLDYIHQFEKRLISVKKIAQIHNKTFDSLLNIILELNIRTICLPGVKNREHSLFLPYFFEIKIKDYFNTSSY